MAGPAVPPTTALESTKFYELWPLILNYVKRQNEIVSTPIRQRALQNNFLCIIAVC